MTAHDPLPELTDGVIVLRPLLPDEAQEHLEGQDEESIRWLTAGRRSTVETTRGWIERNLLSWREQGPTRTFGIRNAETDDLVGMIEANFDARVTKLPPGEVNISYQLYAKARGRGFASRAVELMCGYLRSAAGADVAVIRVHPEHDASRRVAERAGFTSEGLTTTPDGHELERFVRPLAQGT